MHKQSDNKEGIHDNAVSFKRCKLKSDRSIVHSYLHFINDSSRMVDVVWLNFEGYRVKYKTLKPREFVDVNTFVGHPWLFFDSETGDRLVVQSNELFEPQSSENGPPRRTIVRITIPVYSLQERCGQILRTFITINKVDELDLPQHLKEELKNSIRNSLKYVRS